MLQQLCAQVRLLGLADENLDIKLTVPSKVMGCGGPYKGTRSTGSSAFASGAYSCVPW